MPKPMPLVTLPAKTLHERSVEVDPKTIGTPEFQAYLDDLAETMIIEEGVGIASPQVGRNIRVFIVDEKKGPRAFINPVISHISEATVDSEEGCLSVPGVWGVVPRAKKLHIKALDRHGRSFEFNAKGFPAIVLQHETDHLDGTLFIDKATQITKGVGKTNV